MTTASDMPLRRRVRPEEAGVRLDVFLGRQPEVTGRTHGKAIVHAGLAEVDGRPAKAGTALVPGQVVTFRVPPPQAEAPPDDSGWPELVVLHEDPHVLLIDKPAGLQVHPPESLKGWKEPDVAHLAVRRCGPLPTVAGEDRPGIVHRLDKDTSGVMVLAKTDEAFHWLKAQFKARTTKKEYRALVWGDPRFDSDWIEGNIAASPNHDRMLVVREGGREASTFYEVLERFGDITWVRCLPRTGRTHQIRVHMAHIGHPLVGDRLYRRRGTPERLPDGAPDPGRHCLHARSLEFLHPRTHEPMQAEAPLPEDMRSLLVWLQRRGKV